MNAELARELPGQQRAIVESLVQTASEMQQNNASLEARLTASKQEINELQENLEVGLSALARKGFTGPKKVPEMVFDLFPKLTQIAGRKAGEGLDAAVDCYGAFVTGTPPYLPVYGWLAQWLYVADPDGPVAVECAGPGAIAIDSRRRSATSRRTRAAASRTASVPLNRWSPCRRSGSSR